MIRSLRAPVGIGAFLILALLLHPDVKHLGASTATPFVDQAMVATFRAGEIELTGTNLGEPSSASAILLDYGTRSSSVHSHSPLVSVWQDDRIVTTLPWDVVSGELRVVVDGKPSEPVELLVYEYEAFDIPVSQGTNDRPFAVGVGSDGTAWVNQEFHLQLKAVSSEGEYLAVDVPQPEGPGIFALTLFGDRRSPISWIAGDVQIDELGDVWFTQGGAGYYDGVHLNSSRIIRYRPGNDAFDCYMVPTDNAQAMGLLLDKSRGMVWYTETGFQTGAAISGFRPDAIGSDCYQDPYALDQRPEVCGNVNAGCHLRFQLQVRHSFPAGLALDERGNVWFTEYWNSAIGKLTPETGTIDTYPLPTPTVAQGPGLIVGSGPWSLAFDSAGALWINELQDAAVLRFDVSLVDTGMCAALTISGDNPCIEEVYSGSDGLDGKIVEWLSIGQDDRVWFGVTQTHQPDAVASAQLGFVGPEANDAVMLQSNSRISWVAGVDHDPVTDDLWIAQPATDRKLGRLSPTTPPLPGDQILLCPTVVGDACPDVDTSGNGCTDAQELGTDERLGGRRDPHNFWDFYDTPSRDGVRDGRVDLANDILSVIARVGAHDSHGRASLNRYSDPFSPLPADPTAYHPAFDRSPPPLGAESWHLGPPDGLINLHDLIGVLLQYGHSCAR